ncbi:MAG: hypothetical protein H6597_06250 [Flavobacteriales bacterium]|nr:hypothetical protein [Flavobacteriales bacterium]MCB9194116.1 hypothetical protein [Flavobacteriales bacterium]
MTRTFALCSLLLLLVCSLHAQRTVEVGVSSGVTHYYGDLGNVDGPVQWNSMRPGMAITVRDFLNNKKRYVTRALNVESRFSWLRIGYNEVEPVMGHQGLDLPHWKRGLNFRNDLFGVSTHLVLNAYREPYQPLFKQKFFAYFYIGVGIFYGRPKADLFHGAQRLSNAYHYWEDGTIRNAPEGTPEAQIIDQDGTYETDLYSWVTEGSTAAGEGSTLERTSPWHVAIPLGMGIRYMVTRKISLGMEFSYLAFFTDKLDDVSDRYATYDELAETYPDDLERQLLARYISDPTGFGTDGTTGYRTSPRGNPELPDALSYLSLEISYKFKRRPGRRSFVSL